MTCRIGTQILLDVGRKFKPMIGDERLRNFIEFEIPPNTQFCSITEMIHVMESKYRLDFYDVPTNSWVTLPQRVKYPYVLFSTKKDGDDSKRNGGPPSVLHYFFGPDGLMAFLRQRTARYKFVETIDHLI